MPVPVMHLGTGDPVRVTAAARSGVEKAHDVQAGGRRGVGGDLASLAGPGNDWMRPRREGAQMEGTGRQPGVPDMAQIRTDGAGSLRGFKRDERRRRAGMPGKARDRMDAHDA